MVVLPQPLDESSVKHPVSEPSEEKDATASEGFVTTRPPQPVDESSVKHPVSEPPEEKDPAAGALLGVMMRPSTT